MTEYKFIGCDFSGIEARVTAWVASQNDKLDIFRRGECVYCAAATGIFGRTITKKEKDERQCGKCSELALGYAGGIAAYFKMCQMYGVSLASVVPLIWGSATDDEKNKAEFVYSMYASAAIDNDVEYFEKGEGLVADVIKQRWRAVNPNVVRLWEDINSAAIEAAKTDKRVSFANGKGAFYTIQTKGGKFLEMELPSGHTISYFKPEVQMRSKFGKPTETLTYVHEDPISKQIVRTTTYGGKLLENYVQAVSRDIMVESMFEVRKLPETKINLTIHDEILARVPQYVKLELIEQVMSKQVPWALDLPIAVEGWEGLRFKK